MKACRSGFGAKSFSWLIWSAMMSTAVGCAIRPTTTLMSIAEARQQKGGTLVSVGGAVTVPSGLFQSTTHDEGFALQDPTGGIYVSLPIDSGADIGQVLGVTGELTIRQNQLSVVPAKTAKVIKLSATTPVEPRPMKTGAVGDSTDGRLIRVSGKVTAAVREDLPYGFLFNVDDGSGAVQVFVHTSTGIDVSRLETGMLVTIIGLGGRYNQTYEILPRFADDVQAALAAKKRVRSRRK